MILIRILADILYIIYYTMWNSKWAETEKSPKRRINDDR